MSNTFEFNLQLDRVVGISEADRELIRETVLSNGYPPEDFFNFIAHGAYKEVYSMPRSKDLVIKFCSEDNNTLCEKAILEAARREGVECAFIPTQFVDFFGFKCKMPVLSDEDQNEKYAISLEIQPCIEFTAYESDEDLWEYWEDDAEPAIHPITGEVIPQEVITKLQIADKKWIEEYAFFYGVDGLEKLANFIEKYGVYDLHRANIGYVLNKELNVLVPVIIDWVSPSI